MSKGYHVYKPRLRIEFSHRCAYCEIREPEIGGSKSFHIDHYKPKKLFPELACNYDNLVYACRDCNGYKLDYWPNHFELWVLKKIILNPRINKIEQHIDTSSSVWAGKTAQGKWTVTRLKLASPKLVQIREDRKIIEGKIQQLTTMIKRAEQELQDTNLPSIKRHEIENFITHENQVIETFTRKISGPMD